MCLEIIREWFVKLQRDKGSEMAKKRMKKLHDKDTLEFFNQVMVE